MQFPTNAFVAPVLVGPNRLSVKKGADRAQLGQYIYQCCSTKVVPKSDTLPSTLKTKPKPGPGEPGHRFFEHSAENVSAVRVRHILLDTEELCTELLNTLIKTRAHLSDLAPSLSQCPATRIRNGDLGWWPTDDLVPPEAPDALVDDALLNAALTALPNRLTKIKSSHGWHLFMVEEVRLILQTKHRRTFNRQSFKSQKRHLSDDNVPPPIFKTYALQTLGCQMNRADSERMAGHLEHIGYTRIDDPFRAALLILNTCTIRDHAESKVYSYLGRHVARKIRYPRDVTLAVAGCVAQQEGERMLRRIPELDLVFGPQYANRLDELLDDVYQNGCQVAATEHAPIIEDISKPRRDSSVTAWVNVIYGCGENCTYCTVGNVVRTVEQSRSMEAIRNEIVTLARSGIREVVLLGQNIDAYGRDMYPKRTFSELLRFVHDVEGIDRIRFTTSHPRYISEGLVETCATHEKIMPFFHIPPQSGDDTILKAMLRGYNVASFLTVVKRIRKLIPDAAIGGDMIVGFPGETDEQFERSLDLMREVRFDVMNTAAYSPRPFTPAAHYENQVADNVKHDRLQRMNELVTQHALEKSLRYIGRIEEVLVEQENNKDRSQVIGRTPTNKLVHFTGNILELKGKLVDVKIIQAFPFSLQGERAGEPR